MDTKITIKQAFNCISYYNSNDYRSSLNYLKQDKFLYGIFHKRIAYFKLDKKSALDKLKTIALRYDVKLTKRDQFNDDLYRNNYNSNSYDCYDINQMLSDFKYTIYMLRNITFAKNTVNKTYLFLKSIVESKGSDFIKNGYELDFYCHDYSSIKNIDNLSEYVWMTKNEYLSTHIMLKRDYVKFIKSVGGSYTIVDLASLKVLK